MTSYLIEGVSVAVQVTTIVVVVWIIAIFVIKGLKQDELLYSQLFFIVECIFCIYGVSVLKITGIIGGSWKICDSISFNIIPLVNESPRLMLLNTLLFIPFGFLVPRVFHKLKAFKRMALASLVIIVLIEVIQMLFVGRLFDIDDILFNTLGAATGYGFFHIYERIKKRIISIESRALGIGSISLLVSSAAVVIGFPISNITTGDIILYQLGINSLGAFTFRVSEVIAAVIGIIGLTLGIYKRKDRYAYEGITISVISLMIAIYNFRF